MTQLTDNPKTELVSISDVAKALGVKWEYAFTWIDAAKVSTQYVGKDRFIAKEDLPLVQKAHNDHFAMVKAINDAANAEADAIYQKALEDKAARAAAQEQAQAEYKARVRREREEAERARQERLKVARLAEWEKNQLVWARKDVKRTRRTYKLAKRQYKSTESKSNRTIFWLSRRGRPNYEYASTNRNIGRVWAKEIMERYQEKYEKALNVLKNVEDGQTYFEAGGTRVKLSSGVLEYYYQ